MKKIKVLIADDHAVVRSGLAAILDTEADIKVVGLAKNGAEAVETALAVKPDVVIMDIRMPVMDGAEATRELREKLPATKVLILTSFGEADGVALALKSGAAGAITKTAEDAELVTVIRNIASGGKYISPEIEKLLTESPPVPKLTPRQREILAYMTKGLTNVEIAKILNISKDTVEEHVNLLLAKLYASNRTEAVAIAMRKQLI